MAALIFAIASSRGITPESAKKQVCMIVLIRPPSWTSCATFAASIAKMRTCFSIAAAWTSRGSASQTSSGACGAFNRKIAPGAAWSSTS